MSYSNYLRPTPVKAIKGKQCRLIYRKSDNKFFEVQSPHLYKGEFIYLPINNNFYSIELTL